MSKAVRLSTCLCASVLIAGCIVAPACSGTAHMGMTDNQDINENRHHPMPLDAPIVAVVEVIAVERLLILDIMHVYYAICTVEQVLKGSLAGASNVLVMEGELIRSQKKRHIVITYEQAGSVSTFGPRISTTDQGKKLVFLSENKNTAGLYTCHPGYSYRDYSQQDVDDIVQYFQVQSTE